LVVIVVLLISHPLAEQVIQRRLSAEQASEEYEGIAPDLASPGSQYTSGAGATGIIALNGGSEALDPGDLVVFSRSDTSTRDPAKQTLVVRKATSAADARAVIGVVQSAYVIDKASESGAATEMQTKVAQPPQDPTDQGLQRDAGTIKEYPLDVPRGEVPPPPPPSGSGQEGAGEAAPQAVTTPSAQTDTFADVGDVEGGHFVAGSAAPGQHVAIVTQGIVQVKVDASVAPIQAGDTLVAGANGYAVVASPSEDAGTDTPVTIGRALEGLETGTGAIHVQVSIR
jgi:hypothetical protein